MVVPHRVGRRGSGHDQFPGPGRAGCRRGALRSPAALRREREDAPGGAAAVVRRAAANPGRLDRRPPGADASPTSGSAAVPGRALSTRSVLTGDRTGTGTSGICGCSATGAAWTSRVIDLPWLRTAAKRWVAEDLPRRRGNNAPNIWQYTLSSLVELATSLRLQRDDHGVDPPLLGRPDIVAFANRLAFLQQSGTLSLNRRIDILRHIRTVLASARSQGLTRPGQAAGRAAGGLLPGQGGHPPQGPQRGARSGAPDGDHAAALRRAAQ